MWAFLVFIVLFITRGCIYGYVVWFRYDEMIAAYRKGEMGKQLLIELFFGNLNFPGYKVASRLGTIVFIPLALFTVYVFIVKFLR